MKTGIELILEERREHYDKHKITIEQDVDLNHSCQLSNAASMLCNEYMDDILGNDNTPENWNENIWLKMGEKSYKDRLIIAGALIAAEIDRLNYIERYGDMRGS